MIYPNFLKKNDLIGITALSSGCSDSIEEMNEAIIQNFNACVKKNDIVYILGDIAHRTPVDDVNQMIARLNGKKFLCKGNHDKKYDATLFEGIYDFLEISIR